MIKTDGMCILQPICVAAHYTTTPLSGFGWRDVMKFTASLEYLSTQPSGRCARVTLSAKRALACKAPGGSAGFPHVCVMFFAEFKLLARSFCRVRPWNKQDLAVASRTYCQFPFGIALMPKLLFQGVRERKHWDGGRGEDSCGNQTAFLASWKW